MNILIFVKRSKFSFFARLVVEVFVVAAILKEGDYQCIVSQLDRSTRQFKSKLEFITFHLQGIQPCP